MDFWEECNELDDFFANFGHKARSEMPGEKILIRQLKNEIEVDMNYLYLTRSFKMSPKHLNFIPQVKWAYQYKMVPLEKLIVSYFRARSSTKIRFEHKLWNALLITKAFPNLYQFVGVCWITSTIIKVHKVVFGKFLGLKKITSALFTLKGSFQSHGFVELGDNIVEKLNLNISDASECRFYEHREKKFTINSTEEDIALCQWLPSDDK